MKEEFCFVLRVSAPEETTADEAMEFVSEAHSNGIDEALKLYPKFAKHNEKPKVPVILYYPQEISGFVVVTFNSKGEPLRARYRATRRQAEDAMAELKKAAKQANKKITFAVIPLQV